MQNLRDLSEMTHLLQELYQMVERDFGGKDEFRKVLKRLKRFDELCQKFGGPDAVFRALERKL